MIQTQSIRCAVVSISASHQGEKQGVAGSNPAECIAFLLLIQR